MKQIDESNAREINIRAAVESDAAALAAPTVEPGCPTGATIESAALRAKHFS